MPGPLQAELTAQFLDREFVVRGDSLEDAPQRAQLDRAVIGHRDMVLAAALGCEPEYEPSCRTRS